MDLPTFTVEIIKASAWPASVVALALAFGPDVRKLLGRLSGFKAPGGVEATFGEKLDEVEEAIPLGSEEELPPAAVALAWSVDTSLPPSFAIVDAWKEIENRLRSVALARGLGDRRGTYRDPLTIAKKLGLTDGQIQTLTGMRSIRNDVAHTEDGRVPTLLDATRFARLKAEMLRDIPEK